MIGIGLLTADAVHENWRLFFPRLTGARIQSQMSPSKKSARKKHPLPPRVDFETWNTRLKRSLAPRSREAKALGSWLEREAAINKSMEKRGVATRESPLETVYLWTQPQLASEAERARHASVAPMLKDLRPTIEGVLGAIKACKSEVLPEGGLLPIGLCELASNLEEAAFHIRTALIFLDRPYRRSGDALSYCWMFIRQLQQCCDISEMDALSLCRVLMKAHGFLDDELEVFSKRSHDAGTVRKRIRKEIKSIFDASDSAQELYRKVKNVEPLNRTSDMGKQD